MALNLDFGAVRQYRCYLHCFSQEFMLCVKTFKTVNGAPDKKGKKG